MQSRLEIPRDLVGLKGGVSPESSRDGSWIVLLAVEHKRLGMLSNELLQDSRRS